MYVWMHEHMCICIAFACMYVKCYVYMYVCHQDLKCMYVWRSITINPMPFQRRGYSAPAVESICVRRPVEHCRWVHWSPRGADAALAAAEG